MPMWLGSWLYTEPLWILYVATAALLLLASELGHQIGRFLIGYLAADERKPPVSGISAGILGLLAFMLAFTFGHAGSRFDQRKQLVVDESNAIGTAYLRAQLVPDPYGRTIQDLLRGYVDARIAIVNLQDTAARERSAAGVGASHAQIWTQVAALAKMYPDSVPVGLLISSLNDVVDAHALRVAVGLRNHIPPSIWVTIYFLAVMAMLVIGYDSGVTSSRNALSTIALVLAFAAVVLLIIDLDRPYQAMFAVSQDAMVDLQRSISPPAR